MNTIFVTGASSGIGKVVTSSLNGSYHLKVLIHKNGPPEGLVNCTQLAGGLENVQQHRKHVQSADTVLHMAGLTHSNDMSEYDRVNVEYTRALLSVCRPEQRIIYLSTRCIEEGGGGYSQSKRQAESAIVQSGLRYVIIRPAEVYGSKQGEGIDALINLARRRGFFVDFKHAPPIRYSPVSVKELCSFVLSAVRTPPHGNACYTICNDREYGAAEIAQALQLATGRRVRLLPIPIRLLRVAQSLRVKLPFCRDQLSRLTMEKLADNSSARTDYGFSPCCYLSSFAQENQVSH